MTIEVCNKASIKILLPQGLRLHDTFHTKHLKKYHESSDNREQILPEVILKDGTTGQLVEKIVGHRMTKKGDEYLIKWTGERKTTWEPRLHLDQCQGLIEEFIKNQITQKMLKAFMTERIMEKNLRKGANSTQVTV